MLKHCQLTEARRAVVRIEQAFVVKGPFFCPALGAYRVLLRGATVLGTGRTLAVSDFLALCNENGALMLAVNCPGRHRQINSPSLFLQL